MNLPTAKEGMTFLPLTTNHRPPTTRNWAEGDGGWILDWTNKLWLNRENNAFVPSYRRNRLLIYPGTWEPWFKFIGHVLNIYEYGHSTFGTWESAEYSPEITANDGGIGDNGSEHKTFLIHDHISTAGWDCVCCGVTPFLSSSCRLYHEAVLLRTVYYGTMPASINSIT